MQLTKSFCERFLPKWGDRTVDQMVQVSRSIKQNLAEGLTDGQTSFEVEIKLLGIARGSNQELLEDYQDYLKHQGLAEWAQGPLLPGGGDPAGCIGKIFLGIILSPLHYESGRADQFFNYDNFFPIK